TLSPGRRMLSSHRDSARDARLSSRVSREEAAMISEADAVVVGAGALGLSTAFHLARLGVRRVALVDRFALASQTSPRAAGLFKLVQADETRTRLARLSVRKVMRFMEDRRSARGRSVGEPPGLTDCRARRVGPRGGAAVAG